ncbi:MAG: hypothetical protein HY537_18300, partial [Deltaproteobacteria bacterium]|nr:hypothetical protein [Deltaproteobacteria bacterium]
MTDKPPTHPIVLTTTQKILQEIDILVRSRYAVLYLLTHEETRLETLLFQMAKRQGKQLFCWTATGGLSHYGELQGEPCLASTKKELVDPAEILRFIQNESVAALFLLKDFHPFLDDPHVVRRLR